MKNLRSVISGLSAIILMLFLVTSGYAASGSGDEAWAQDTSEPRVHLRAASGMSILFRAQNGPLDWGVSPPAEEVPHLVLRRNGSLTDPQERTLVVEVSSIQVPPPGVTVTLRIETQHEDPDLPEGAPSEAGGAYLDVCLASGPERRIPVWREARWIANSSRFTSIGVATVFTITLEQTVMYGTETTATPTDYFRYEVAVMDPSESVIDPVSTSAGSRFASPHPGQSRFASPESVGSRSASTLVSRDHAFLMENQWIARLPEVPEATQGAAPDELIVYYLDMVPFRRDLRDPATWLAREDVSDYVGTELVPQMVEAFRVQSEEWRFPWYEAWTSYRPGRDAELLSVALSDGSTWYHGEAPLRGHSGISIRVSGGDNCAYDTFTDGLMSSFHHELFHNLQRNISLNSGGDGIIDGADDAWQFFSEGTAVLASSVGQPKLQFRSMARAYMANANGFMGYGGLIADSLNTSYEEMSPYHAVLYWRLLYEQCSLTEDGSQDPAAGMQVIRRALTILYSGDVVDISASTDLVGALPEIMDRALSGSPCPFDTHAESLAAFARALYALRLEDGRCEAPGSPAGCGFYDPYDLYHAPAISSVTYSGGDVQHTGEISSSFGVDFVDLVLDPAADGCPLTLELQGAPPSAAEFSVQVWKLKDGGEGPESKPVPTPTASPKILEPASPGGGVSYVIPAVDTAESNRLGVIITRVDTKERSDPVGAYTIYLRQLESAP